MFRLYLIFTSLLMAEAMVASAQESSAQVHEMESVHDILPSPYFIDGEHCIGTNQKELSESWLISKEEVEITNKIDAQEDCEDLLRAFGLEKYKWFNPEDLESASSKLKQSGFFEDVELFIKKSELKNHIHVFMRAKTKPRYVYSLQNELKFYENLNLAAVSDKSARLFNRISGEVIDRTYQPNSKEAWGFQLDTALASNRSLMVSGWESETLSFNNISEAYTNINKNYYIADFYFKHNRMMSRNLVLDFIGHLLLDNVQSSGPFVSASAYVDTDLVYSRYIRYIRGTFYGGVGLVFSSMRSTPSYAFLPGLKMGVHFGRDTGTFFRQDVSVFHSLFFPISFFQGKTEFQVDLGENINGSLIFKFRDVQSLVFPRDFAPSTDLDSNQSAFGFSKNFVKDKSRTQLDWRLGYEWLGYTPPQGVGESVFTSLGYKLISDDLNVNFSFGYYFQRVY